MATYHPLSTAQLRRALQLSEQIDTMQQQLHAILGSSGSVTAAPSKAKAAVGPTRGKRTMSAAGRARIAAAARARWAKIKSKAAPAKATPAKATAKTAAPKKKGGLTAEGRAKLAAAMKARWEAKKKGSPAASS